MSDLQFWLITAPADKSGSKQAVFELVKSKISDSAQAFKFDIPELKVGTLDALMQLSDEMAKADQYGESTVAKLAQALGTLIDKENEKIETQLLANGGPLDKYLQTFQWQEAKYPTRNSIRDLVDSVNRQMSQIESEMKSKMASFNTARTTLVNLERKQTGNLLVRSIGELVKKDDFVLDSEYLITVLVVVPKFSAKEFIAVYEQLCPMVVPRSAQKITEDNEYILYTVTLFKRAVGDFKVAARERKFIVREFEYNEAEIEKERNERSNLGADVKKQTANLLRWVKTNFTEAFMAWIHLKALRAFVESVLRYGLPVNFQALIICPKPKGEKKTRDALQQIFGYLSGDISISDKHAQDDATLVAQVSGGHTSEYYPYVYYQVNIEFTK